MSIDAAHELGLLGELAELGMVAVRRLSTAIEAAEGVADLVALIDALAKAGRGVRQSIALSLRIKSGTFPGERPAERAAVPADAERPERSERPERADWNEYERPDWETPELLETEHFETDIDTAVVRIRRDVAKGIAALKPEDRPTIRAGLLTGTTALRLVDTS